MNKSLFLIFILGLLCLSNVFGYSKLHVFARDKILNEFKNKSTKDLFKVFHFVFNKSYDYNTELGIRKFNTFKNNLRYIEKINLENKGFKLGITVNADMTNEEYMAFYNLKPITVKETKELRKNAITLDDYNEDDPIVRSDPDPIVRKGERTDINWKESMSSPVRYQGNCGSCWAFSTIAIVEGNWNINKRQSLSISPQQLVDCDTTNFGCNGGWYTGGIDFYKNNPAVLESNYKYEEQAGTCRQNLYEKTDLKVTGYLFTDNADSHFINLQKGPMGVAIDASSPIFQNYKEGVLDLDDCTSVNHAVVLIGYSNYVDANGAKQGSWIIQNSWGDGWGDQGYVKMKENFSKMNSCWIGRYGYLPLI
jgi:cathepsin L/cathepsin K